MQRESKRQLKYTMTFAKRATSISFKAFSIRSAMHRARPPHINFRRVTAARSAPSTAQKNMTNAVFTADRTISLGVSRKNLFSLKQYLLCGADAAAHCESICVHMWYVLLYIHTYTQKRFTTKRLKFCSSFQKKIIVYYKLF